MILAVERDESGIRDAAREQEAVLEGYARVTATVENQGRDACQAFENPSKDGVQVVPRSAEVFDPGLISTIRDRATPVEETAFIDNSAPVGYELDL